LKLLVSSFKFLIFSLFYFGLVKDVGATVFINKKFGFGELENLGETLSGFVVPVFSLAASLVVLYFIFAGFKYLSSGGNKEEISSAQKMIQYAIIGFVILMAAFLILQFLLVRLFGISELKIIGF